MIFQNLINVHMNNCLVVQIFLGIFCRLFNFVCTKMLYFPLNEYHKSYIEYCESIIKEHLIENIFYINM